MNRTGVALIAVLLVVIALTMLAELRELQKDALAEMRTL